MIDTDTAKAIQILVDLFTDDEKETLKITSNNEVLTLGHQLLSRWGGYKVIAQNPIVFKAKAAQILEANRSLIEMIKQIKEQNLFEKLLDPENYKDKRKKGTKAKRKGKVGTTSDSNSGNLVKNLSSSLSGEEGLSRTLDYSTEGENQDIERLASVQLERNKLGKLKELSTETGNEDHTKTEDGIDEADDLDTFTIRPTMDKDLKRTAIKYNKLDLPPVDKSMHLQSAAITRGINIASTELEASSMGFTESLIRQNFDTTSERYILANAVKDIQNLEFVNVREKLYRKFDPLFYEDKKTCP